MNEVTRRRNILIIDGDADYAASMAKLLRYHGHQVNVARTGTTGLAIALETIPDAILLDIALPRLNGLDVALRLRASGGFGDVLIVAISGYGSEEVRARSADAGIDHHLLKPTPLKDILALLRDKVPGVNRTVGISV